MCMNFNSLTQHEMEGFKQKLLTWGRQFDPFVMFDSNLWEHDPYSRYEWMIAAGSTASCRFEPSDARDSFADLSSFRKLHPGWTFGYFSYDLKNELENLHSLNPSGHGFSSMFFFVPEFLLLCTRVGDKFSIRAENSHTSDLLRDISEVPLGEGMTPTTLRDEIRIKGTGQYQSVFERLQYHIHRGDIYETNYCLNFSTKALQFDPYEAFDSLRAISPMPFSAIFRDREDFLISASPERFMQKQGDMLMSQPMKGTIPRGKDGEEDARNHLHLASSEKERSENTMITDLVRNDLGRSALTGTVEVSELCKIIAFPGVWQMISSVKCKTDPDLDPVDAVRNAFPMGSMTGAPKIRAMEIIEQVEDFRRGLYSGSVGYFDPDGNFDFNVVIRSILYTRNSAYLSFPAGGAITADSEWELEYRECMLKASSMFRALTGRPLPIS